jgi:hypothetical protein
MIPLLLIRIELRIKNIDAGFLYRVKYDLAQLQKWNSAHEIRYFEGQKSVI